MSAGWIYLSIAILFEVAATSALKASDGMSRLTPTILALVGYGIAFFCLARAMREVPLGVAYAVWSGVGIVALVVIDYLFYSKGFDIRETIGIAMVLAGVLVIYSA
ncbi:multidrug efflux SMR transporter [Altererythrobacter sp. BO-6]|uniref:DMT family transporter n=1 Tax=Altererythrobacter sp. BO-6 TaxID=2604537 RepID=UPI0013E168B9|nr:multidrug efflux SMR transporter [Altererythrobacter sp. BO-6]QIG54728.1 multidrug efflux SMR transporter [Altererythrobacter sp. BO-6]